MTGPRNSGMFEHMSGNVLDAMADDSDNHENIQNQFAEISFDCKNDASNTDDQFSKMFVGSRNNKNSSNRP